MASLNEGWGLAAHAAVWEVVESPIPRPTLRSLYEAGEYGAMARIAYDGQNKSVEAIAKILVRKQQDYGHANILRFGKDGVLVRLWDKVARYENLTKEGTDMAANFESVEDTLLDIIGYVTILRMLEKNTFTLDVV